MLIQRFLSIYPIVVLATLVIIVAGGACANQIQHNQKQSNLPKEFVSDREGDSDGDRIRLPSLQTEFFSAEGNFCFIVSTKDNWQTKQGYGRLIKHTDQVSEVVWEGKLPQEYGPRYVLVSRRGEVLMLDEWINVKSKYVIVLLNPQNNLVIQHDFEKVQQVLQVPISEIVQKATQGSWWISAPPSLDQSLSAAYIQTAGKVLRVDLQTGELKLN